MWKTWHSVLCWLAVPVLVVLACLFQDFGFDVLQAMRQLERTPRSQIISVIEGEINLEGQAVSAGKLLSAPHSNTECLYYLYILEEERTDSDGDTYWAEIRRESRTVDRFNLQDASGIITVRPQSGVYSVGSDVYNQGSYRHTEYRFHPGDTAFVFGYARNNAGQYSVEFESEGQYTPVISTFGEKGERQDMASSSLLWSFGALASASFAVMFCCWGLKVHRLLVFLSIVSMVQGLGLVYLGLTMLKHDLESSRERAVRQQERAQEEIGSLLRRGGESWSGDWADRDVFDQKRLGASLPAKDLDRVQGIYGDVAAGIARFNAVRARFPERFLAPLWGVKPVSNMPLAESLAPGFDGQKDIVKVPIGSWTLGFMLVFGVPTAIILPLIGFRKIKEKRYIENIPTSLSTGLAYGPAEIKGVAMKDTSLLKGPLSGLDCIYYHYKVKERRGSGKKAKWVTITDEEHRRDFICKDSEGQTPVRLDSAEIHTKHKHYEHTGNRMYFEWNLRPDDQMYILGPAIVDDRTGDRLMFARDDSQFPLIVANLTEDQMMHRKGRRGLGFLNLGLNGFVLSGLAGFGATASYAPTDYLLAAFIAPVFLAICFIVLMYNDLQFVRHRVRRAWANIDVSLKKRANLIPNLESVVKQYLKHESELQEGIAEMRSKLSVGGNWDPARADDMLAAETAVTGQLLAAVEAYPDLKGNTVVQKLFNQIVTMENEIALMRQGYNDSVERHNTRIQRLPEVVLARLFGYQDVQLLRAEVAVRKVPKVELSSKKS